MKTCAICTSLSATGAMERLDAGGPLYWVCHACSTETPRESRYGARGYEPSGGLLKAPELTAAMRRVMGDAEYERVAALAEQEGRTPAHARTAEEIEMGAFAAESIRRKRTTAAEKAGKPISISAGSDRRRKW